MIKRLTFITALVSILSFKSNAQENQNSIIDEISYVYIEKLVAVAKENYPRIKALNSKIISSESVINGAKLGWLSPLSLSYVYSPTTTLNLTNPTFFSGYQIGFSLNLSSFLQTPSAVKQAKEALKISKYDLDEYLLTLTTEVKTRYFNYLLAVKALKISAQASLDAQNSFTLIKYKYEKGEAGFEEYNNAATQYASSTKAKLDSEVALLTAKISLEELLGIRLEEVPN